MENVEAVKGQEGTRRKAASLQSPGRAKPWDAQEYIDDGRLVRCYGEGGRQYNYGDNVKPEQTRFTGLSLSPEKKNRD